jgi:hypothetical protein
MYLYKEKHEWEVKLDELLHVNYLVKLLLQEKGMEKGDWGREKRMMKLLKRFWKIK